MKKLLFMAVASITLMATTCNIDPGFSVPVKKITITPSGSVSVEEGKTITLVATVSPTNAAEKGVIWSSSNNSRATVNANGVVSGVSAGTVTITATAKDESGVTATKSVTVTAAPIKVTGITITPAGDVTVEVGKTTTLSVTITPNNAAEKGVTWSSSNTSRATVSAGGVVTGVSEGAVTITATAKDGSGKSATKSVSVIIDPDVVDEGVVINGVRWATRNVGLPGKFTSGPEVHGMVYQWGSNIGWSKDDPLTATDGNNTWRNVSETGNTWSAEKNPCPSGWRLPTQAELQSLINSGHTYTANYEATGVAGRIFGSGMSTIFLPAVNAHRSHLNGSMFSQSYKFSYYWSSTPHETKSGNAWELYFNFDNNYVFTEETFRSAPFFIRCVK